MKKLLTLGLGALFAVSMAMPAFAEQPDMPQEPVKMARTQKPVMFPHKIHTTPNCMECHSTMPRHFPPLALDVKQQCIVCHHLVGGEEIIMACSTSGCHDEFDTRDKSLSSYYRIAHARDVQEGYNSCLSCHYEVVKTRPEDKQRLTACAGSACHPKN